jgi:hypothetical protein
VNRTRPPGDNGVHPYYIVLGYDLNGRSAAVTIRGKELNIYLSPQMGDYIYCTAEVDYVILYDVNDLMVS